MHLVFKGIIFILLLINQTGSANELKSCANISLKKNVLSEKGTITHLINVVAIDNIPLLKNKSSRTLTRQSSNFKLLSGEHTLTLQIIPYINTYMFKKGYYIKEIEKSVFTRTLFINTEENFDYELFFVGSKSQPKFEINQTANKCVISDYPQIKGSDSTQIEEVTNIPLSLKHRLIKIMHNLESLNVNKEQSLFGVQPLKVDNYFGTIIDKEYTPEGDIKVLSTLPVSLAQQLGFRSGDIIKGFNQTFTKLPNETPRTLFNRYVSSIAFDNLFEFEVERNEELLILQGKKSPMFIPESYFHIKSDDMEMHTALETDLFPEIKFEYEQVILSLYNYLKTQNFSKKRVVFNQPSSPLIELGIQGKEYKGEGVLVTAVSNGILKELGVQEEDLIIQMNEEPSIIDNAEYLLNRVASLQLKEPYGLTVIRADKKVRLTGQFSPIMVSDFKLTVSLDSFEKGHSLWEFKQDKIFPSEFNIRKRHTDMEPNVFTKISK